MDTQKRFKKQELNKNEYKGMEQGAKALKGVLGLTTCAALIAKNKENLVALGNSAHEFATKIIKR